ncbi:hypothetical protein HYS79_02305 [Patescibacteria group bacterium]|nr:hypothetical protein [Patescibacteria group bacterium]
MFYTVFRKVFSRIYYLALAAVLAGLVFAFATWLPNLKLINEIAFNSPASITEKIILLYSLLGSIQTNFSTVSAGYTIAIAVLFGINTALLAYYLRTGRAALSGSGATLSAGGSVGGLVSGVFGIGCAACGTFLFTSTLALFGAGGLLALLPFGGEEFGFLGVGLLAYSTYVTAKKITEPLVCEP